MDNDRAAVIQIGGCEYNLILTTRAVKEISKRYGGLSNLGEKLLQSDNFEMALEEIVYLITLLANQGIMVHNLHNKDKPLPLLSEDEVELLTSPYELAEYKSALQEALFKGTKRMVESEDTAPNVIVG